MSAGQWFNSYGGVEKSRRKEKGDWEVD